MNISPTEAEKSLEAIQRITQKTRRSIASSGVYITLIVTGMVWLIGFLATQFLTGAIVAIIWTGVSVIGSAIAILLGNRSSKRVRSTEFTATAKRAIIFWLLLICFAIIAVVIARPIDGKQLTMFIILFSMIGQSAMGMILSFSAVWWALPITIVAMLGYLFLPGFFYLWMGVLGGGGMIVLGVYIHARW